MRQSKGFTLIELMIVVAILAILAAIAWPAYQRHSDPVAYRRAQAERTAEWRARYPQTRCIAGYTFTDTTNPVQVLNSNGNGIPCAP